MMDTDKPDTVMRHCTPQIWTGCSFSVHVLKSYKLQPGLSSKPVPVLNLSWPYCLGSENIPEAKASCRKLDWSCVG
jgi:hypothetical protein